MLMWTLIFISSALLIAFSSSPLIAIMVLIMLSVILGWKTGLIMSSWFFFTLIIIYVGGMMVMFCYLSSLINSFKINQVAVPSLNEIFLISLIFVAYMKSLALWKPMILTTNAGFFLSSSPLIVFLILFLLLCLILIFKVCEKSEGPLKSWIHT